ncbi:MAG: TolC family protein [Candidatus Riflebacteria bacterium]|nr:TolC family protein [Candidatus Riflebacteria bacterium]
MESFRRALGVIVACVLVPAVPRAFAQADATAPTTVTVTLDDAIQRTLQCNPGFASARQAVPIAKGRYVQARAGVLPKLSATTYRMRQNVPGVNMGGYVVFGGGLYVPQMDDERVDFSVQLVNLQNLKTTAAANHEVRASRSDVERARIELIATVKKTFYDVLLADELIRVHQAEIAVAQRQLDLSRLRYTVGSSPELDVLRAEVKLENDRPQLLAAVHAREIAEQKLLNLMALPSNLHVAARGRFAELVQAPPRSQIIQRALDTRPEVTAARERLKGAHRTLQAANAGYLPTVTGAASYDKSVGIRYPITDGITLYSATVQMNVPIFDGLATSGKVREALGSWRKARSDLASLCRSIELEIIQALSAMAQARAVLAATDRTVHQADRALTIAQESYRAGARTHLEVLDAQLNLTQARSNRAQALRDYSCALADLERAQGLPSSNARARGSDRGDGRTTK